MRRLDSSNPRQSSGSGDAATHDVRLFLAVVGAIVIAEVAYLALFYVPRERRNAERAAMARLAVIADDRKTAVERWVAERLGDAEVFSHCCAQTDPAAARSVTATLFTQAERNYGYRGAYVVDLHGTMLVHGSNSPPIDELFDRETLRLLATRGTLVDFSFDDGHPLVVTTQAFHAWDFDGRNTPPSTIILVSDPNDWLFPSLRKDTILRTTEHTDLVRRDGAKLQYLTPAPEPRVDGSSLQITRTVAQTPWVLIARMDRAEVLAPVRSSALTVGLSIALMTVALAMSGLVFLQSRRARYLASLARSEARFAHLLEHANDAVLLIRPDGTIVGANSRAEALYGYSREELFAINANALRAPEMAPLDSNKRMLIQSDGYLFEALALARDGTRIPIEISARSLHTDGEVVDVAIIRDIRERKQAEHALRKSEHRFQLAAQATGVFVCEFAPDGTITYCSSVVQEILGYAPDELVGIRSFFDFVAPEARDAFRARWQERMAEREPFFELAVPTLTKDGASLTIEIGVAPIFDADGRYGGYVGTVADVTVKRELEMQLRHAQKMEAIGSLAGGVAHDFNNLLQAVTINAQMLHRLHANPPKVQAIAANLYEIARSGSALTRQLLLTAHKETSKFTQIELNEAVRDSVRMLRRLVKENIAITLDLANEPLYVKADRGHIDQVLVNLVVNASDAMPDGGRLIIRTTPLDEHSVQLSVQDTGHGIAKDIRERIFEPFFTTKGAGKGTGLGLSVVHGIVTQHEGTIDVESTAGAGTTFRITLPRERSGSRRAAPAITPVIEGHGEHILLVEDAEGPRVGLHGLLSSLGYDVTAVADAEAVQDLPADRRIDLLLTDLVLPGMSGEDLAADLRGRNPHLAVIFMSGHTANDRLREEIRNGRVRFLQKPFDVASLTAEIRAALHEVRAAADRRRPAS